MPSGASIGLRSRSRREPRASRVRRASAGGSVDPIQWPGPAQETVLKRTASIVALVPILLLALAVAAPAETGFQLGIPALNVPDDPDVNGMRLSILYGRNERTEGLDLGFFSLSQSAERRGLGLVFGMSRVTRGSYGANLSLVNVHDGTDKGLNVAFMNVVGDTPDGFNTGIATVARGATGFDLSGFNMSERSKVQVGFVNVTKEIETFQLGFFNFAENGFVPFFPLFNFPKR
jgi:hypothetical protein